MNVRPISMVSPLPVQQQQQMQQQMQQQLLQQHLQHLQPASSSATSTASSSGSSNSGGNATGPDSSESDLRPTTDAPGAFRQCPHCLETIPKASMKKHLLKEHRNISLDCPHCGRHFKMRHHLRQHIVGTHLKLKNYACRYCSYTSTQSSPVITHERVVHHKLKLYECRHGDGFSTNNGPSIKSHLKKEHGVQEPHIKEEVKRCRVSFAKKKKNDNSSDDVVVKSEPQVLSASIKEELIANELNARGHNQQLAASVKKSSGNMLPQVPLPPTHLIPQAHSILAASAAFPSMAGVGHGGHQHQQHSHQHSHQHLLANGINGNNGGNNVTVGNNVVNAMNSFFCKRCAFSSADGHVFLRHIKDVHLVEHPQFL